MGNATGGTYEENCFGFSNSSPTGFISLRATYYQRKQQQSREQTSHLYQRRRADTLQELRRVSSSGRHRAFFCLELQGRAPVGEIYPRKSAEPRDAAVGRRSPLRRILQRHAIETE